MVRVMCHRVQEARGKIIQVMRSGRNMRPLSITCKTIPPLPFGCKPHIFLLPPLPRPPPLGFHGRWLLLWEVAHGTVMPMLAVMACRLYMHIVSVVLGCYPNPLGMSAVKCKECGCIQLGFAGITSKARA